MADAIVTLGMPGARPVRVLTDGEGRFAFFEVPAGHFSLAATRPGYSDGAFGRLRPSGPSQALDVAEGARVDDATIQMWKLAVVAGTVADERGEPLVGATVQVLRYTFAGGRRQLTMGPTDRTDDRGMYRIGELEPGDYVVAVPMSQGMSAAAFKRSLAAAAGDLGPVRMPAAGGGAVRVTATTSSGGGSTRMSYSMLGGDSDVATAGIAEDGHLLCYRTEFYPAAPDASHATPITLRAGEEHTGMDFQMTPARTIDVSGTVLGPDGPVASTQVELFPADAGELVTPIETDTAFTDGQGGFTFNGVPAGRYTLRVVKFQNAGPIGQFTVMQSGNTMIMTRQVVRSSSDPAPPLPTDPTLWAEVSVVAATADLTKLIVPLQTGAHVSGHLEFDGTAGQPDPDHLQAINVSLIPADGRTADVGKDAMGRVASDGSFTTMGVPAGRWVLQISAPQGWSLAGATINGRDITDQPLDMRGSDVSGVIVSYTDKPTHLSGAVTNGSGSPDGSAEVFVFPTDRAVWTDLGPSPRRVQTARTGTTGAYSFANLPPGDYFLAAVSAAAAGDPHDPAFLASLADAAATVRISQGGTTTQSLKTVKAGGE